MSRLTIEIIPREVIHKQYLSFETSAFGGSILCGAFQSFVKAHEEQGARLPFKRTNFATNIIPTTTKACEQMPLKGSNNRTDSQTRQVVCWYVGAAIASKWWWKAPSRKARASPSSGFECA